MLVLMSGACDEPSAIERPHASAHSVAGAEDPALSGPVTILWAGCASMVEAGRCERGEEPMTVWIPADDADGSWWLGDSPLTPSHSTSVLGGIRVELSIPRLPDDDEPSLILRDSEGRLRWELTLAPDRLHASRFAYQSRLASVQHSNDPALRLAFADELLADLESVTPVERLARIREARRLRYIQSDIGASVPRIQPLLKRSVELARSLGRWGEMCEATAIGLFMATYELDRQKAEFWRPWVDPCQAQFPRWQVELDYYLGVFELRQGRYAQAELRLNRALRHGTRLDLPFGFLAHQRLTELLIRTARWSEARRAIEHLESAAPDPCTQASFDSDLGFYQLIARQRADVDLGDPRPTLRRSLAAHERGQACEGITLRNHDLIKLGMAAALEDDLDELGSVLARIDPSTLRGKYRAQYQQVVALDAIGHGDIVAARAALDRMALRLSPGLDRTARWQMHMLYGEVAELEGHPDVAIEAYRRAEAVVQALRDGVVSGVIRERWLGSYRKSAIRLVDRLVEQARLEEAACAARRARSRALEIHDFFALYSSYAPAHSAALARDSDSRCERPWSRYPDELVLLWVPREAGRWWVFEVFEQEVQRVHAIESLPEVDARPSDRWWDRWTASLARASRIRVIPSEAAFRVPFHRLGWNQAPLASRRPVEYGMDLAPFESNGWVDQAGKTERAALIAFADFDPMRSLARYAPQVAEVDAVISSLGWASEWLESRAVDRLDLGQRLSSVALFHYFGHGERVAFDFNEPPPGLNDVGSTALLLDGGIYLGVDDVLGQARVPRWVSLLGCRLGYADLGGWSGGLSVAQAFLLAGSEQVAASTEVLDAAAAAWLGPRLYPPTASGELDLAYALQQLWAEHRSNSSLPPLWKDLRVWSR